jgi:hypothetical protein
LSPAAHRRRRSRGAAGSSASAGQGMRSSKPKRRAWATNRAPVFRPISAN